MKKSSNVIRWIGVAIFAMMSVYALSEGGFIGALLFLLGGAAIAPLDIISKLRRKFKLNKALTIVLAVVLLFAGSLATPTSEISSDNSNSSQITETVSDDTSSTTNDSSDKTSTSDKEQGSSETSSEDKTSSTNSSTTSSQTQKPTNSVGTGSATAVKLSSIPAYSGKASVVINNNVPNFSASELTTKGYEKYSSLDSLGRTQVAVASVGKDTMPAANESRGDISSIKPTGWNQAKYECVSGGWLYNRCHLIGWQLSAENANKGNLITGTKYLNISGMLPFENMVADYIKETNNHVAYRITPIYDGNNLLASGVQMEAYSVEDNGEGICFNVYCYNVQPQITINYATGASTGPSSNSSSTTTSSTTKPTTTPDPEPAPDNNTGGSSMVWIPSSGSKYHSRSGCSGMKNPSQVSKSEAESRGYSPCYKCW